MSWLVSGLIVALILGLGITALAPKRPGRYWLSVSLIYASICAWNLYLSSSAKADRDDLVDAMGRMLVAGEADADTDAGRYAEYVQYVRGQNAESEAGFAELGALAMVAYETFDFALLPKVSQCDSAIAAWSNYATAASRIDKESVARQDNLPSDIAELDIPDDFKRGLLEGLSESDGAASKVHSQLMNTFVDLASYQSDGCRFLATIELRVDDGSLVFSDQESEDAYRDLYERGVAIEGRMEVAYDGIESLAKSAAMILDKHR